MSKDSRYVVTMSDRTTLLQGPLGVPHASIPRLVAAHGLKLASRGVE